MDGDLYLQILKDELQQTLEYYGLNPPDIIFEQDNDPKHTCRLVKNWLEELARGTRIQDNGLACTGSRPEPN